MKYIVNLFRVLVGALFIFSGFVKAVDPLGTSYKNHDYFAAFESLGAKPLWEWMNSISLELAVIMIVVEMVLGVALLTGWANKFTTWMIFLMTLFFTLLTGFTYLSGYSPTPAFAIFSVVLTVLFMISAAKFHSSLGKKILGLSIVLLIVYLLMIKYTNLLFGGSFEEIKMKVTDCGCFGDAIKLKPAETFYKDVVLDIMIFILVIGANYIKPLFKNTVNNSITIVATVASLLFCFSNYIWGLPLIDFRAYKVGTNLVEARKMQRPEIVESIFTYKNTKTGEQKMLNTEGLKNLDYDVWEYVDRKDSVIDAGIPAPIHDFYIYDEDGVDITDTLLADKNYSLMVVTYKLEEADKDAFSKKLNPLAAQCEKAGINFYTVFSGSIPADPFRHELQTAYPFYECDPTALKTVIRSNPGLLLLKNGVVINMWHYRHFPTFRELNEKYFSKK